MDTAEVLNRSYQFINDHYGVLGNRYSILVATTILIEVLNRFHVEYDDEDIEKIWGGYVDCSFTDLDLSNLSIDELENVIFSLLTDGVDFNSRKKTGSERTPIEIADYMIDAIKYEGEEILDRTVIDPSCGTGVFVSRIMRRYLNVAANSGQDNVFQSLCESSFIQGYDTKPSNVFITKIVCVIEMIYAGVITNIEEVIAYLGVAPFYCKDFLMVETKADYVIGNPPYIRLQNLPADYREFIKEKYKSATGRFDIYVCFLEKASELLNENGRACLITSNKYLTTNYGKGIRQYLTENVFIQQIVDLFDTKFFGAAVLPAIIVYSKGQNKASENTKYIEIKTSNGKSDRSCNTNEQIFNMVREIKEGEQYRFSKKQGDTENIYEMACSCVRIPLNGETWNFSASRENGVKEKIERKKMCTLGDLVDICVGVKSTADSVFVRPMTEKFIVSHQIEKELVFPLIQSFDVDRWELKWGDSPKDRYILYPHYEINGEMRAVDIKKYPNAYRYIMQNEKVLKKRRYLLESKTRQWYECWVPQTLSKFRQPKLVTRDIVSHNSFALDDKGMICQGNTFFLTRKETVFNHSINDLTDQEYFYFLLGILNTKVMECYQKMISGCLYSKKYRYTTSNLRRWPIPMIDREDAVEIADMAKKIAKGEWNKATGEKKLNQTVDRLFGLNEDEIQIIDEFVFDNA